MTTLDEDLHHVHARRARIAISLAIVATVPAIAVRILHPEFTYLLEALIFGGAIVGAAFLLSWAAEVAQLDISAGLALAVLALIAVLPEYAVDFVFAWDAGQSVAQYGPSCPPLEGAIGTESPCSLALANMTGANRLLIGVGWTMVVFIVWYRTRSLRKRRAAASAKAITAATDERIDPPPVEPLEESKGVQLSRSHAVEVCFLALATLYSLFIPLKASITLIDAVILVSIFVAYTIRVAKAPAEEPHLVGPARYLGTFSVRNRRITVVAFFAFAAAIIILCAERFAEALVATGTQLGVSEFLLVQWIAPLASEAPELLVAGFFAWRLNSDAGLGTLVSSKVNQWTLLVGTLPIVFAISSKSLHGLPIDAVQREELFLTAAQSFFAVAVLLSLSITNKEAMVLFGLFWAQFILGAVVPESLHALERIGVGVLYLFLGTIILIKGRALIRPLLKDGLLTPYHKL